jgi:superfamily I DNA/RNA helicase
MVTGGAGTGKTVTALHRAAHLAKRYGDGQPILMTAYNVPLAEELGRQLDTLIEDPEARARVEVRTTDSLAARILAERLGYQPAVMRPGDLAGLADKMDDPFGTLTGRFVVDEWEQVVLAQDITDLETYLGADRRGRGTPLQPEMRRYAWTRIQELQERLRSLNQRSFLQIADEAAKVLAAERDKPYRHIIVDEGQDLHPAQWRLLRAAVPEGPDDLFLVADPHQRIYQHRVSMRNVGVKIVGRTQRLTVSYRTTQEILSWAVRVLGLAPAAEIDDWPDSLEGYESPMHGRRPIVRRFADWDAECDAAVDQVRSWLSDGAEPSAIVVTARENRLANSVGERLRAAHIPAGALTARSNQVRLSSLHSLKGLEFQCVAVVGARDGMLPHPQAVVAMQEDPIAHRDSVHRERCLLYVACTRARDRLYVSYSGTPSPFLPR